MKLTYVGPYDAVSVPLDFGGEATCERGGTIDVPDELGERLLEQESNWQPARSAAAAKSKDQKPAADPVEGGDV